MSALRRDAFRRPAARRRRWLVAALALALVPAARTPAACLRFEVEIEPIAFGSFRTGLGPMTGRGTVRVICHGADAGAAGFKLLLGAGRSGRATRRSMAGTGGGALDYNLFLDPAHRVVWGDGSDGTQAIEGSFPAAAVRMELSFPIYGIVPGGQQVRVGTYGDDLLVTVVF